MIRRLFIFVIFFVTHTLACLPGYEAEREKLKEYLGIEWLKNGLENNAFSNKPIRNPSDLNCNFAKPSQCRWKNMEAKSHLDSTDFFLFEKTDYTEFPPLKILPGPSNVQQGEKLLFTGDKKREEQHAIFFSSPIPCQNSTGNLTFTYWVYNGARVEVVLIEDDPKDGYKIAYEKPDVNCGMFQILNTEGCHAEIAPRNTPFRLGIRAFDMANKEGSFAMIDNIIYNAELCNVAIDMGTGFKSEPLATAAEGRSVVTASDLNCENFDGLCRWRGMQQWKRSTSPLPNELIYNLTGTNISPRGAYAIYYIEQGTKAPLDYLRSDQIDCQSMTENMLTFRFWKSTNIELSACAVDSMSGADIECYQLPAITSPSPVGVSFHKASTKFNLAIKVEKKFDTNSDSIVIVDGITYSATLCTDALSAFDLGQNFVTTPMISILLNRNINRAEDLNCDFSRRGVSCLWGWSSSGEFEDNEIAEAMWAVGHGPLSEAKFRSLTGSVLMPHDEFGLARLETGGSSLLFSEIIRCVLNAMTLEFDLWLTGSAGLQVCLLEASSPVLFDCQPLTTGHIIVDLPSLNRPFRIALRAMADDQGLVIVDDIKVKGDVCPSSARQYSSKSFRPTAASADLPDFNVCRLLSCDFQRGHPCLYESARVLQGASHRNTPQGLTVQLDTQRKVAILESSPFHLNTICRLHFNYELNGDAMLFVCNDSGARELENCFRVDGRQGDDYIELLPSDTKLYMIARLNGTSGTLQLRNTYLTDSANVKC